VIELSSEFDGSIHRLTLNRPARRNALTPDLARALAQEIEQIEEAADARVILLSGAGGHFCAGLDLSEPPSLPTATRVERLDPYAWVGTWVRTILSCEKPVVAAVNGPAAGAGFGLALACDVRIVASSARMTAGYVRRGLSPDAGVSWLLPRHVGLARASDILLTGRDLDAAEAERIGLAAHVVADAEFADRVRALAAQLASGPPVAHALTKRLLVRTFDTPLDVALRDELVYIKQCFETADVAEAISAFREKRRPSFRGE